MDYFIDAPIELYLISVLWSMYVGSIMEGSFDSGSYGSRLHPDVKSKNGHLFKMYHKQYERWRNDTLSSAKSLLDSDKNLLLITLDFKECFYNIKINWDEIERIIHAKKLNNSLPINLTRLLCLIHKSYHQACLSDFSKTHKHLLDATTVLPIGLPSSRVLCNYHLDKFDKAVRSKIEPHHYARYVDDVFIIISNPSVTDESKKIIKRYFRDLKVLKGAPVLQSVDLPNMSIMPDKFIIQFFNHNHSRSALKVFTDEIQRQASEFRLLPTSESKAELDYCAYDLIYKGSKNKWRSVIDIIENGTEVSKFLAKQIIAHRLSEGHIEEENITKQLFRFFQGRNLFNLIKTWEKVFTYFIIKQQYLECTEEVKQVLEVINRLNFIDDAISKRLKNDIREFLTIALTLPASLIGKDIEGKMPVLDKENLIDMDLVANFRRTNLLRHHYTAIPLLNYTNFEGNLTAFNVTDALGLEFSSEKLYFSPRFLHVDEHVLFKCFQHLTKTGIDISMREILDEVKKHFFPIEIPIECKDEIHSNVKIVGISVGNFENKQKLKIGIANIDIPSRDIEKSINPKIVPNISFEKQGNLFALINECDKNSCEMLLLPEVSVPLRWLSVMVNNARRRQIALVFGVEHVTVNNCVLNFIATILPFSVEGKYQSAFLSLRLKNHYAPAEQEMIEQIGKEIPVNLTPEYHLFFWKGLQLSTYNCFELADLEHRNIFKSELDLLVASVWNRDTDYYANILESTTRDLFCYAVQVNTSKYGDSRVYSPHQKNV